MFKKVACLLAMIMLLPLPASAAYKIYLKNGSAISGVSSYEKKDGEVLIHLGGGSMGIPEKDILKIEETGASEKDFSIKSRTGDRDVVAVPPAEKTTDRTSRADALRAEIENLDAELKALNNEEARLATAINEKMGRRYKYNIYQLKQLELEIEPLQKELFSIRNKKSELLQTRAYKEGEFKALQ